MVDKQQVQNEKMHCQIVSRYDHRFEGRLLWRFDEVPIGLELRIGFNEKEHSMNILAEEFSFFRELSNQIDTEIRSDSASPK